MMISDAIRNAESEYVIYFLLAAYIEAAQFGGKLPEYLMNLPITGLKDVEMRLQQLMMEFDRASGRLHEKAGAVVKEALHIFEAALCRLKFLEREKEPWLASNLSGEIVRSSARRVHGGISSLDIS